MPIYDVHTLDLIGNVVEGFEVNDTRRTGEVYIRPDASERQIVAALAANGDLVRDATRLYDEGEGEIIVDVMTDRIELTELDTALAAVSENGELLEYIENENELEHGEHSEEITGQRPILSLEEVRLTHEEGHPFWEEEIDSDAKDRRRFVTARVDSKIEPKVITFEFASTFHDRPETADTFDYWLVGWQRSKKKQVGFDPSTGEEIQLSQSQYADLMVAFDYFLETGKELVR